MGRPVVNKGNIKPSLKYAKVSQYKELLTLARTVSARMVINIADFPTPIPPLTDLDTAADSLRDATIYQGLRRNKGSKFDTQQAKKAAKNTLQVLTQLLQYVINTALIAFPDDAPGFNVVIAESGFSLKNIRRIKHISQSRYVRQDNSNAHPSTKMRLQWKRGVGLIKGAPIAGYIIRASNAFSHL